MLKSIKTKLIVYFLLFAIVPLLIFGIYSLTTITTNLTDSAKKNYAAQLDKRVDKIRQIINSAQGDLHFLKESFATKNLITSYEDEDEIEYRYQY